MATSNVNPWLEIPATDYETHMQEVGQLQLLNRVFREVVSAIEAKAIAVLGCTTGNGFEHIDFSRTTRVVGIDINPDYLELARRRYGEYTAQIEWRCADLHTDRIGEQEFDLIHAALIFEYLDLDVVLPKIHRALRTTGLLSVVLQLPTKALPAVSATPYTSLEKLAPIMRLLTPEQFRASAIRHRFVEVKGQCIALPGGKSFWVGNYRLGESSSDFKSNYSPAGDYFLRSERLGFRLWSETDIDLAMDLWGDFEVTKLIGGPFSREQVQDRLSREIANMQLYGIQYWPIFLLKTDGHVGCCGLRPYKPDKRVYEIGFHIKRAHWRQGYAHEAARAVIGYAFRNLDATELFAGHNPKNIESRRLLEKLGFRYTHDEYYAPTGLNHPSYALTAEESHEIINK